MSTPSKSPMNILDIKNYQILYSASAIREKVKKLTLQIKKDYDGKNIVVVTVLDGAVFFTVDLVRELQIEGLQMEFIGVASYQGTTSTEKPFVTKKIKREIQGHHVLIVEDVLDTGITLDFVQQAIKKTNPASLKTAVLVRKNPEVRKIDAQVDYVVFDNVHGWLIGYGFDVDGHFRHLKDIYIKKDTK